MSEASAPPPAPGAPTPPRPSPSAAAEQATPEALRRAYRLLEGANAGYWEHHLRTGQVWYSPSFYRALGIAQEGLGPTQLTAYLHPDDRQPYEAAYLRAIHDVAPFRHDLRFRTLTGEYHWVRATGRVWPGADGRPELLIGMVIDVHPEKLATLEREALQARFERAMAATASADFERVDADGSFYVHPRICELLGYPPGTPTPSSETFRSWMHPEDRPRVEAESRQMALSPGPWDFEYRLRHANGHYRYVRSTGRAEREADGHVRMTGMLSDVHEQTLGRLELERHQQGLEILVEERTGRLEAALAEAERQREQAEAANEAKSRFLAHMSHEIRTPLNGVLGMTELALRSATNDQQRRHLKLALQSGRTLMGILNDVLDFSRISAGQMPAREEPLDLAEVMAETLRAVMPSVRDRDLGMMFDYVGEITRVRGDRQRLQQIASNLLSNAARFTERGHLELMVHVEAGDPGWCQARIVFRDTGPGMAPEVAARIFEPFVQGDQSLGRRHGGAGLGLPIALGLAHAMNGELMLETAPGQGSSFTLEVPLRVEPGEQPAARRPPPGTAWLVDTRSVPAQWMVRRLARLGWRSEIVAGVAGAMRRAAMLADTGDAPPQLVILAEAALEPKTPLLELRSLLPGAHIVLQVRPDWLQPQLESAARAALMRVQLSPVTPQSLLEMLEARGPSPGGADSGFGATTTHSTLNSGFNTTGGGSGFMDLPFLPDIGIDVLVAEDNPVNQIIVSEMIDSLGLKTRLSSDGAEAIEACRERPPALVLMDLQMPGMDGLQAARALRRLQARGELPPFPIVALTAHATPQDRDNCIEAGMVGFITKPVGLGALRSELARWLRI